MFWTVRYGEVVHVRFHFDLHPLTHHSLPRYCRSNHDDETQYDTVVVKVGDNENVAVTFTVVSFFFRLSKTLSYQNWSTLSSGTRCNFKKKRASNDR